MSYDEYLPGALKDLEYSIGNRVPAQLCPSEAIALKVAVAERDALRLRVEELEEGNWPFEWVVATREREQRERAEDERDALRAERNSEFARAQGLEAGWHSAIETLRELLPDAQWHARTNTTIRFAVKRAEKLIGIHDAPQPKPDTAPDDSTMTGGAYLAADPRAREAWHAEQAVQRDVENAIYRAIDAEDAREYETTKFTEDGDRNHANT